MAASDDSGSVYYGLANSENSNLFTINGDGGLFLVSNGGLLSLSVGDIIALQVEAADMDGNLTTAEITVNVQPAADPPAFASPSFTFDVPSDTDGPIGTVTATDNAGSVFYSVSIDPTCLFSIDSTTGAITVNSGALAGSAGQSFDFQVEASDMLGLTTTANITVNVVAAPSPNEGGDGGGESLPDLAAVSLTRTSPSTLELRYSIRGPVDTSNVFFDIVLYTSDDGETLEMWWDRYNHSGALVEGEYTITFAVPHTDFAIAVVDAYAAVSESDESNNRADVDLAGGTGGSNMPDLYAGGLAEVGSSTFDFSYEITKDISAPYLIELYESTDGITLGSSLYSISGEMNAGTYSATLVGVTSASYVVAILDPGLAVNEINEDNNDKALQLNAGGGNNGANFPPTFSPPSYEQKLGRHKTTDEQVLDTNATDPDPGDTLTYRLGPLGNEEGLFRIDTSNGLIKLKKDVMDAQQDVYHLRVYVSDNHGATDSANVIISVFDSIGLTGDTHAVEGSSPGGSADDIKIRVLRFAKDPNASTLTAYYTIDWKPVGGALLEYADFEATTDLSNFAAQFVFFGEGEIEKSFTLSALPDGNPDGNVEGIEGARVTLLDDPSGAFLVVNNGEGDVKDGNQQAIDVFNTLRFFVLDDVTLFGKQNVAGAAVDNVNGDNVLDDKDLKHSNPGIHYNDIYQGNVGDCGAMAGMAALANESWQQIESRFTPTGLSPEGFQKYNVTLWNGVEWKPYKVTMELVRGFDMADLSFDVDDQGRAEIWPILLEKAFAELMGGYAKIDKGVYAIEIYTALTGLPPSNPNNLLGMNDVDRWDEIDRILKAGHQVIFNSITVKPQGSLLRQNHSYLVTAVEKADINNDGILEKYYRLYNPHGGSAVFRMPFDKVTAWVKAIEVLPNVP